ncbi:MULTISPECIES: hypothetical protein [unclassified Leisingera]|uniref:hypothetical protein n=1 Tax=unclassified Leisingera TaxID=2614906 RepID=UPI001012CFA5|nr:MULTISPECIES: hypothetical protein [unclassified Leisingera]MCF6430590.1 hypothetical protein [Leisingera sp. MMG026]QAX32109.1 hypothetical protein ETW24_22240 [Leisingera sp. NJS204]
MTKSVFASLTAQLQALHNAPAQTAAAGHCPLAPDAKLWLSTDPEGQAKLTCAPAAEGFTLTLEDGDSGLWASLGFRLERAQLCTARYLGLLAAAESKDLLIYTPTLRYYLSSGGFTETAAAPVVAAGGALEQLSHIPVDPSLLARSSSCEFNLFFQTAQFQATFRQLEPLTVN